MAALGSFARDRMAKDNTGKDIAVCISPAVLLALSLLLRAA